MSKVINLSKDLLQINGLILVSIDNCEVHRLRLLMDYIFGVNNFIGTIVRERKDFPESNDLILSDNHDYTIVYSKDFYKFKSTVKSSLLMKTLIRSSEVGTSRESKIYLKELFKDQNLYFDTPKPVKFIEYLLNLSQKRLINVLDCFAGSGVTGVACNNLNILKKESHYIFTLIEAMPYADSITAERLRRDCDFDNKIEFNFYSL